jgi:hypothetical protein
MFELLRLLSRFCFILSKLALVSANRDLMIECCCNAIADHGIDAKNLRVIPALIGRNADAIPPVVAAVRMRFVNPPPRGEVVSALLTIPAIVAAGNRDTVRDAFGGNLADLLNHVYRDAPAPCAPIAHAKFVRAVVALDATNPLQTAGPFDEPLRTLIL